MVFVSTSRSSTGSAFLGTVLLAFAYWAIPASADEADAPAATPLEPIVVTATKHAATAADEELTRNVAMALRSDPFFYDEHVTVSVTDGVVTLQGVVFDDWDLRIAMRISNRVAGVKSVSDELEIGGIGSD
jgi:hypothetical protein